MGYIPLSHNPTPHHDSTVTRPSSLVASEDAARTEEAKAFYDARPALQIAAACLKLVRGDYDTAFHEERNAATKAGDPAPQYLTWWSLHDRYDAYSVMDWFTDRPDIRQQVLTRMCNFPARAGRAMPSDQQAGLIESVIESGDRSNADFDHAVRPEDVVVYGPADELFHQFAESLPMDTEPEPAKRDRTLHVLAGLLLLFVEGKLSKNAQAHRPIMSYAELRLALGLEEWHRYIPLEDRVNTDKKRLILEKRRPDIQFTTRDEIGMIGISTIVKSFPFSSIRKIFEVARQHVRFDPPRASARPPSAEGRVTASHVPTVRGSAPQAEGPASVKRPSRIPLPPGVIRTEQTPLPAPAPLPIIAVLHEQPAQEEISVPPAPSQSGSERPEITQVGLQPPEPAPPQAAVQETIPEPKPEATASSDDAPSQEASAPIAPDAPPASLPLPKAGSDEVDGGWGSADEDSQHTIPVPKGDPSEGHPATAGPAAEDGLQTSIDIPITVDPSVPPPAAPADSEVPPSGVIADNEVAYIPNEEFDRAAKGGVENTVPPPHTSESTSDLRIMRLLIEIKDVYQLHFPNGGMNLPHELVRDMHTVLTSRGWLDDERRMKDVIVGILHAVAPEEYPVNGIWSRISFPELRNLFTATLKEVMHPVLREVATGLEALKASPA